MNRRTLDDEQKEDIVRRYRTSFWTQTELGSLHGVHRRTIYRVLVEAGVITAGRLVSPQEVQMLDLLKKQGYNTPTKLRRAFYQKTLPARAA